MTIHPRDKQHQTYADYLTWSGEYGDEVVNGIAYVREPPSPSLCHQEIVVELCRQAANALQGKHGRALVAPCDVRLPKAGKADDQIDTVVQPDVLIVCDYSKLDKRGVCGAPDWVAEVLSPSTASRDQVIKLPAYESAGVREVWIIQPDNLVLTIYRHEAGRYTSPITVAMKGRTTILAVPEVTIDWDQLLANIA